jgi:hypothetical protein
MKRLKISLPGLLLRVPIVMAAGWLFLIALYAGAGFSPGHAKDTVVNPGEGVLQGSLPSLRDIECSSMDDTGKKYSIKAEAVTTRDRQYGDAIFTSFKDVVVSHARVFTKVESAADFLDWVNGHDLYLLMGLVLADNRKGEDDISAFGSRLVIEDLEVYGIRDGGDPRLLLSADEMTRESVSDEVVFTGRLTLEADPAQRIICLRTARWLPSEKTMYFPEGCQVNGKLQKGLAWLAAGSLETGGMQLMVGGTPPAMQRTGLSLPSGERIGPKEILKLIKKKDHKAVQELLLQYVVLNPDATKQQGVLPMLIMGPGFKLGQFTPGPLMAGMSAGQIEVPAELLPRPQVSEGTNLQGLSN